MSISDLIVVMRDGVLQQIDRPQAIYDDPVNLFVAQFLGTPPVNVFHASIRGGWVMLGDRAILNTDAPDQEVWCAIRPEGLSVDAKGPLACDLRAVEVMGRDVSVVAEHPALAAAQLRAIDPDARRLNPDAETVRFAIDPEKVFLFSKADETRIRCRLHTLG